MNVSWMCAVITVWFTTHITLTILYLLSFNLRKLGFITTADFIFKAYMILAEPFNLHFSRFRRFTENLLELAYKWFRLLTLKFLLTPLRRYNSFRKVENYATANWNKYAAKYFKKKPTYADIILSTKFKFKW